jgi:predicted nucleic acid-binding protein
VAPILIDANVFLRHLTQDHPDFSPRASTLFARIERGELRATTSATAIFETIFTLQRRYGGSREEVRETVGGLLNLAALEVEGRNRLMRALDVYVQHRMSFGDAYNVALMEELGIEEIASFDRDFEKVPGIRRIDPR